jgi:phage gp36-like protein
VAYLSQAEFLDRFGQQELSDLLQSGASLSYDSAEADAAAIIDSYLASAPGVIAVPLATVPDRVRELCGEIARYRLWGSKASEQVQKRYDAAIAFLEKVASGEYVIPGIGETPASAGPSYLAKDRVFTDDSLAGF